MNARDLPYGAREIAELRANSRRPADLIIVSMIGPLRESNPVIVAKPGRSYDWRFLVGLSVVVVTTKQTTDLPATVKAIESAYPRSLAVWFADHQDGLNLRIQGYRPSTKAGRRMGALQRTEWAGLGTERPEAECLKQIAHQVKGRIMANAGNLDPALAAMAQAGIQRIFGKVWEAV